VPYLRLPDARIFYTDQPAETDKLARPVLFVHGWLDSSDTWVHQLPALRRSRRVVAFDMRGHGSSEAPDSRYDAAELTDDLARIVTGLELGPVVVVAHSMGASLVSRLAVERACLVCALVLVDPDYGGDPAERQRLWPVSERETVEDVAREVARLVATGPDARTADPHLREWHQRTLARVPPFVVARSLRANLSAPGSIRFRPAADALLPRRRQPVLAFHRDPARAALERSLAAHPATRVVDVLDSGHWIHQEHPELVSGEIERWLGDVEPGAATTLRRTR
jgi:pimeloyl-ACP methyl ester carboxylesterase